MTLINRIRSILELRINVDIVDHHVLKYLFHIDYMLYRAAYKMDLQTIKYLVSIGADVNTEDSSPLILMATHGVISMVQHLMSAGARFEYEAMFEAAKRGHVNVVAYFISLGANLHEYNDCVLRNAVEHGQLEVVRYLISIGADPHRMYYDCNLLKIAAVYGQLEMVRYLISINVRPLPTITEDDFKYLKSMDSMNYTNIIECLSASGSQFV